MKRIIYSVGFFLVILFLCAGFLLSYQMTELKDRIYTLEENSVKAQQKVSALADARGQVFIFEGYEKGTLKREAYRITSYNANQVVLRQEKTAEAKETAGESVGFQLKLENGFVVVYKKDSDEVYEYTDIPLENLPKDLQSEILLGKTVKNPDDLYKFLENYSS